MNRPDQTHTFVVIVAAATEDLADRVMTERLDPDEDYGFPYTIPNWIRVPEDNPHTCIFDDTFRCLACEIKQAYGLDGNHASPENATVTLPMKIVLGWFMASDPTPLKPEEDSVIRELLDARSKELGFEGGWIEAFHKIEQFDPSSVLEDVNTAVAALNKVVCAIHDFPAKRVRPGVPDWLLTAITEADRLVNDIQDGITDPDGTGLSPRERVEYKVEELLKRKNELGLDCTADESAWIKGLFDAFADGPLRDRLSETFPLEWDEWSRDWVAGDRPAKVTMLDLANRIPDAPVYALNTWDPAGSGKPVPATHWYYQNSDGWMAVVGEDEAAWFEDREDGTHTQQWPNPRVLPATEHPKFGLLRYRKADGTEVEVPADRWDA